MRLIFIILLFCWGGLCAALFASSDTLFVIGNSICISSGLYVTAIMASQRFYYTSAFFFFHLVLYGLAAYLFLFREHVVDTKEFVFTAFTEENLQAALLIVLSTMSFGLLPWLKSLSRFRRLPTSSPRDVIRLLVGRLELLGRKTVTVGIAGSFVLAAGLFTTNVSVLDFPYPIQGRLQWVPGEVFKIPVIVAVVAIFASVATSPKQKREFSLLTHVALANFLFVSTLVLLLIGSRGFVTFLALLLSVMEFYLAIKVRKTSAFLWGTTYAIFTWYLYFRWPLVRADLASVPFDDLIRKVSDSMTLIQDNKKSAFGAKSGIHVQDFTMIGASIFHLLYVIQLLADGNSLEGQTFFNLLSQILPEFLDGILWDRPIHDAERLREHYYHGGGFLVIANAYWNGGWFVTLAFVVFVTSLFVWFDRRLVNVNTGLLYKLAYWLCAPVIIVQLGYGIQGLVRVMELLAAVMLIDRLWKGMVGPRRAIFRNKLDRVAYRQRPEPV